MIEIVIGLLCSGAALIVVTGYAYHRRQMDRPAPPPPPPRVEVWRDEMLVYAGPERRAVERVGVEVDTAYRWPSLVEVDTEPQVVDPVATARGEMTDGEVAAAVRLVFPVVATRSDDGREWVRVVPEGGRGGVVDGTASDHAGPTAKPPKMQVIPTLDSGA